MKLSWPICQWYKIFGNKVKVIHFALLSQREASIYNSGLQKGLSTARMNLEHMKKPMWEIIMLSKAIQYAKIKCFETGH